ncbi:hypothetical protein BGZ98_007741 [Dissophora globulifera]|uniref:Ser-Thr-rich glycosyl-phosphatidyl-inositol-anchored membrane family-domain-containing protein n=1 Tax=Dissophora globulifera TaxID=979702 RepID=A0A9P6RT25_9FUNG|nr:hypothetical protein BGZ98_007741 [Dissophora globulifera]KAG0326235.1 hypothetical protein BGZ99_009861 [Dissophora globulifera]
MRFSVAALATSLLSAVLAQQAYPTVPIESTVWTAGDSVKIQWKSNAPTVALAVDLFKGDPTHQTLVTNLGSPAAGATSLAVVLPATLAADWYSIRIGDSYSHYFEIKGKGGVAPTGTMPVPPAATTVAAPGNSTTHTATAPTVTKSAAAAAVTGAPNSANYLSAAPMAMAAVAIVAAALAL